MTENIAIERGTGEHIALSSHQLQLLSGRLRGPLLRPGDRGWSEALRIWNGMVATKPAIIAQPENAHDVAEIVRFARERDLRLSVKAGGHNIAGTALVEGGLTLDMCRMRDISVDPAARLARVGPGCLLGDVDRATQEHGLATVLGIVSEVGVAGLTLGGGFGYLTRRFGWAVDNLDEVEIVTAEGEIRNASGEENPDLFWAVRGGGGNFGVVTRFTFRLHEVGPTVTGGLSVWSAEHADAVLAAYRGLTETAPRELTAALVMRLAPPAPFLPTQWHGRPIIGMLICHSGRNGQGDLAQVRACAPPIADLIGEKPYVEQQSTLDGLEPKGLHYYWKTEYLPGLSPAFLEQLREHAYRVRSPISETVVIHLGGALNERSADDGAVGNRDARFVTGFAAAWPPDAAGDPNIAWARAGWQAIRPFSTGGNYVNFQLAEDDSMRTASAYGSNYERLQRIKARYDRDNLFRVNRNISPAA